MNTKILVGIIIGVIIVIGGIIFVFWYTPTHKCPESCDDGNPCTQETCSEETNYKCSQVELTGPQPGCLAEVTCGKETCKTGVCQIDYISDCCGNKICELGETYGTCSVDCSNCDDNNECTKDSYDYHAQKCVNAPMLNIICCGNTVCETGETYQNCARDCPNCNDNNACTKDSYDYHEQKCVNELIVPCCGNTVCEVGETYTNCVGDCPSCNDNNTCTKDSYDYRQQKCLNEKIIPCCGNGVCDKGTETYSNCSKDCPNCDDNSKLTGDSFNYTTQKCEHVATHYLIDDFEGTLENWNFLNAKGEPTTLDWEKKIEDGNTVLSGTTHHGATVSVEEWTDYIFKFRFKRIKGSLSAFFRLNFTESGSQQAYHVSLKQGTQVELQKIVSGELQSLKDIQFSFDENWHTFEIRGYGNVLNVYIDDKLLIKYQDTESPFLSGSVAFRNPDGSESLIDDVEIKVITEEDVIYP